MKRVYPSTRALGEAEQDAQMTQAPLTTIDPTRTTDELANAVQLDAEESVASTLFYRTNNGGWHSTTPPQAEHLLKVRTWDDPWVTVVRTFNAANDPDGHSAYFQVLGIGSDALLIEGGGNDAEGQWLWTSSWEPPRRRRLTVGPDWYRYAVSQSEVQTESDALAQIWVALADGDGAQTAPNGYRWDESTRPHDPLPTPSK